MAAEYMIADDAMSAEIDGVVAACNGDLRGALRALLLINEQLERQLQIQLASARSSSHEHALETMH